MAKPETIFTTKALSVGDLTLANDYKYVNARDGQVGMSVLHGDNTTNTYVVLHFARVQFQPSVGTPGLDTAPINSALATVELSMDNAKALRKLLDQLLTIDVENDDEL